MGLVAFMVDAREVEPLAVTVVGVILGCLLTALIGIAVGAYRSNKSAHKELHKDLLAELAKLRSDMLRESAQTHNFMRLMFSLLRKLNPDKAALIAEGMEEFLVNGKAKGAVV